MKKQQAKKQTFPEILRKNFKQNIKRSSISTSINEKCKTEQIQHKNEQNPQYSSITPDIIKIKENSSNKAQQGQMQIQNQHSQTMKDQIPGEEILYWLNIARTKPKQIAKLIIDQMQNFIDDKHQKIDGVKIISIQGKSAYEQAIDFLNKQKPLPALQLNDCLAKTAEGHTKDMIKNKIFGHVGSNGSSLSQRVEGNYGKTIYGSLGQCCDHVSSFQGPNFAQATIIRYIIDQGVPSRGHRKNIYNQSYKYAGASMIKCQQNRYKSCVNFCSVYLQNQDQRQKKDSLVAQSLLENKKVNEIIQPINNLQVLKIKHNEPSKPGIKMQQNQKNRINNLISEKNKSEKFINHYLSSSLQRNIGNKHIGLQKNIQTPSKSNLISTKNKTNADSHKIFPTTEARKKQIFEKTNQSFTVKPEQKKLNKTKLNPTIQKPEKTIVSQKVDSIMKLGNGKKKLLVTKTIKYSDGSTQIIRKIE